MPTSATNDFGMSLTGSLPATEWLQELETDGTSKASLTLEVRPHADITPSGNNLKLDVTLLVSNDRGSWNPIDNTTPHLTIDNLTDMSGPKTGSIQDKALDGFAFVRVLYELKQGADPKATAGSVTISSTLSIQ